MAQAAKKTEPTLDDLRKEMDVLKADIHALTQTLKGVGEAKGSEISDNMRNKVHQLQARATEGAEKAAEKAEDTYHKTEDKVRENPAAAMGIAAAAGFVVGLLANRK
ncbi:DUF883 family protein [Celeribacter litoreus]|uniref:DUF883 family protein n=1 Tax=Celeribacter litoreus TaxID=2876714 RepID=UPI001CCF3FE1|nr:DUF883 domain-containing protein [Celeribacter litoreus]MCA0042241.1 DUF883 domain-containing protein [Celeribacter litoreus]